MKNYDKQSLEFLEITNTEMQMVFSHNGKHFPEDDYNRDIYDITLKRGQRSYNFSFGQSIVNSAKIVNKITGDEFMPDGGCLKDKLKIINMAKYRRGFMSQDIIDVKGTPPSEYDVLTCLTIYDPGTFEDFCGKFDYNTDSRIAERTYKAVKYEYISLCMLFSDEEMEKLSRIQ